jgi:AcrR family transcriptional regulator
MRLVSRTPATRQRPRSHSGTQPAELAIFEATEALLREHALHEISVAQIIERAGLSRASFYHYFGSKFDVLAALMNRIWDQVYEATHTELEAQWDDPSAALRSTLGAALTMWDEHRDVIHATLENMHADASLDTVWTAVRGRFEIVLVQQIVQERAAGRVPSSLPAPTIAAMAVAAAERIFYVGSAGMDPHLKTSEERLDAIVAVTLSAIYGHPGGPTA